MTTDLVQSVLVSVVSFVCVNATLLRRRTNTVTSPIAYMQRQQLSSLRPAPVPLTPTASKHTHNSKYQREVPIQFTTEYGEKYSTTPEVERMCAMRLHVRSYARHRGVEYEHASYPEFSRCLNDDTFAPFRAFVNTIGHVSVQGAVGFEIERYGTVGEMLKDVGVDIRTVTARGFMWHPHGLKEYVEDARGWKDARTGVRISARDSCVMTLLRRVFDPPLSVHTWHAHYELKSRSYDQPLTYSYPELKETTRVMGLLGTLHNNASVDMATEDDDEVPNIVARLPKHRHDALLCAAHTSHSHEAGRVRRLCCDVRVRLMCAETADVLVRAADELSGRVVDYGGDWIVYCMGRYIETDSDGSKLIIDAIRSLSHDSDNAPTLHIDSILKCVLISVSSGVVVRKCDEGYLVDELGLDAVRYALSDISPPTLPAKSDPILGARTYLSAFYSVVPWVLSDRSPRSLFSSVQSLQAVSSPAGAGTSVVFPVNITQPLCVTKLVHDVEVESKERRDGGVSIGVADFVPGIELLTLVMNHNENYEDCIMVNKAVVDRGAFSTLAVSNFSIPPSEPIPDVGERIDFDTPVWKVHSTRKGALSSKHAGPPTQRIDEPYASYIAGGDGSGVVRTIDHTRVGSVLVTALGYRNMVDGDKLATGHGQKGVVKLTASEDMPFFHDDSGNAVIPDAVIAVSSIVNRMTAGQYYELVASLSAVEHPSLMSNPGVRARCEALRAYSRTGSRILVDTSRSHDAHSDVEVLDGTTGMHTGCYASFGVCRYWQMTQMTWDKQHYTHRISEERSLRPRTGRSKGGTLQLGEMEIHALAASGLIDPLREIIDRGDMIVSNICRTCKRLGQLCTCSGGGSMVATKMPSSLIAFDCVTALLYGYSYIYDIGNA